MAGDIELECCTSSETQIHKPLLTVLLQTRIRFREEIWLGLVTKKLKRYCKDTVKLQQTFNMTGYTKRDRITKNGTWKEKAAN